MTKQEIDALVEAIPYHPDAGFLAFGNALYVSKADVREALFLAAGLNADGSEKAKVVRARVYTYPGGQTTGYADAIDGTWDGTTFTPDGAK